MLDIETCTTKLSGEHLKHKTSISSDDARLDIVAENFWGHNRQRTLMLGFSIPFVLLYTMSHYHSATAVPKWKRNGHLNKGFVKSSLVPFPH